MDPADNLVTLLERSIKEHFSLPLFGEIQSEALKWTTYGQFAEKVAKLRGGLTKLGIKQGSNVGIISKNCEEWAIIAFATYGVGACLVPMAEDDIPNTWKNIISQTKPNIIFVSNAELRSQIVEYLPKKTYLISQLETIYSDSVSPIVPKPEQIATIVFTSGINGKGISLSHKNLAYNAHYGLACFPEINQTAKSISILPWVHLFGQVAELYSFIKAGGSIGFMRSLDQLPKDLIIVRPTYLIVVPRLLNRFYTDIQSKVRKKFLYSVAFDFAIDISELYQKLKEKKRFSPIALFLFWIVNKTILRSVKRHFGGSIKNILTGGASISPQIARFFWNIGVPLYDCYGLTETSPATTMSSPQMGYKYGSVGKPIEGVTIKIDPNNEEIVVYGHNVMKGYYEMPDETEKALTSDGGFRTGDKGRIDDEGYLFITGSIKEQYKLLNGKYIYPAALEEQIVKIPEIKNVLVAGSGKQFNVCLIEPNYTELESWLRKRSLLPRESLALKEYLLSLIIIQLQNICADYEIPQNIQIVDFLPKIEEINRLSVTEKYKPIIDSLYY